MPEQKLVLWRRLLVSTLACAGCLLACGQAGRDGVQGGDTHWLVSCGADVPCDEGVCQCGLCTLPCADDDACRAGPGGTCADLTSEALSDHCFGWLESDLGGACLQACSRSRECAAGQTCVAGACVVHGAAAAGVRPGLHASDFAGVEPPVMFDGTQPRYEPDFTLTGDGVEALVGVWEGPCLATSCYTVRIEQDAMGQVVGSVSRSMMPDSIERSCLYWPVLNPDVVPDYRDTPNATVFACEWPYRMFEARVEAGTLTASISLREPWDGWCQGQTSYEVAVGDHVQYQCAPTDLPSDDDLGGYCDLARSRERCAEYHDGDSYCADVTPCACDAQGCGADWHDAQAQLVMQVSGDRMRVTEVWPGNLVFNTSLALERQP